MTETLADSDPNKEQLQQKVAELQQRYLEEKFNSEALPACTEINEAIAVIGEAVNKSIDGLFRQVKDADETTRNNALKIAHMRKTAMAMLIKSIVSSK